jgi:FKBP-type peptidyl-prolyl cis-trans isomerase 2
MNGVDNMPVKKGDKIKVEYTGTLNDGTVFDSSERHDQPLEFEAGSGKVIKGFDEAVIGMGLGEEKEIKIPPSEAYGDHNPQLIKKAPRSQLPKEPEPKAGMMLVISAPNGAKLPATITEVTDETVTIDLNHPLAGKTLNFKIKVVDISS